MFFRYPGGKSRLAKYILPYLIGQNISCYCEPFFGAGHIGIRLLKSANVQKIIINDLDYGIYAIWKSIYRHHIDLIKQLLCFVPTEQAFFAFKEQLLTLQEDVPTTAFKKIAIHQMSYSGLGVRSGGPIGGKSQSSSYSVSCRWNVDKIIQKILQTNQLLTKLDEAIITNKDWSECLEGTLIYFDPPYYDKGNDLYQYGMRHDEHTKLANTLKTLKAPWFLSYDDHPLIWQLYNFAGIKRLPTTYTINSARKKYELLISNAYSD